MRPHWFYNNKKTKKQKTGYHQEKENAKSKQNKTPRAQYPLS
jgi:hypothetical protein